jgi:hypothetical protein
MRSQSLIPLPQRQKPNRHCDIRKQSQSLRLPKIHAIAISHSPPTTTKTKPSLRYQEAIPISPVTKNPCDRTPTQHDKSQTVIANAAKCNEAIAISPTTNKSMRSHSNPQRQTPNRHCDDVRKRSQSLQLQTNPCDRTIPQHDKNQTVIA